VNSLPEVNSFPALELSITETRGDRRFTLALRAFGEADIPAVTRACADPLTQQWVPVPRPYTREDAAMWIASQAVARRSGGEVQWAVTLADSDTLVGAIGLVRTDWSARVTEVGYWAVPEHRGQGYITLAARSVSRWALGQGMERVELLAATGNLASNRVALAAGFRFEELRPGAAVVHDRRYDMNVYAMTRVDPGPGPG
jgi:RimJ/RimL family protein N-acetyltransferase